MHPTHYAELSDLNHTKCVLTLLVAAMQLGQVRVPTGQTVSVPTQAVELGARPVDMAVSGDGRVFLKTNAGLKIVGKDGTVSTHKVEGGASLTGIAIDPVRKLLYYTDAASGLHVGTLEGRFEWRKRISLPKPKVGGEAYPCGIAILKDGQVAVALNRSNSVVLVDPERETSLEIPVDVAPYRLAVTHKGDMLYVTCWSATATKTSTTAPSSGTDIPVDGNGIPLMGTLAVVDIAKKRHISSVQLGLQPTDVVLDSDSVAYVAEANSDRITRVDFGGRPVLSYLTAHRGGVTGNAPNALALAGRRLYVALGGANELAVYDLAAKARLAGWIPTTWYPGALAASGNELLVATIKGVGKGPKPANREGHSVYDFSGHLLRYPLTAPLITKRAVVRTPVPTRPIERSPIEHVVYVIKENRTYDQVFGDIPKGDGDPNLTIYGRNITPNHHALAEQFVLLDNFYCNGVNSADGHAWAVEGNASTYLERAFGGWTRSYPFGDDPLS